MIKSPLIARAPGAGVGGGFSPQHVTLRLLKGLKNIFIRITRHGAGGEAGGGDKEVRSVRATCGEGREEGIKQEDQEGAPLPPPHDRTHPALFRVGNVDPKRLNAPSNVFRARVRIFACISLMFLKVWCSRVVKYWAQFEMRKTFTKFAQMRF